MKAGLKLWSNNADTYLEEAQRLFQIGACSYLELYVVPGTLNYLDVWKGLDIPFAIHCPHSVHGFNLANPELESHNKEVFKEVRLYADSLNADYIVIHGGLRDSTNEQDMAMETARQLKNLSDSRAVIENKPYLAIPHPMFEGKLCVGYNKKELSEIISVAECGFCLDIVHAVCAANSFKIDYFEYVKDLMTLKPAMFHMSGADNPATVYDSHLHLKEDRIGLKKIATLLPDNAKVTLETKKSSKTSLDDFVEDEKFFNELKQ